jgi:hypothetical protein
MKHLVIIGLFLIPDLSFAQEKLDTKIIITLPDSTTDIYNKVRYALGEREFIIKEDGDKDTVTTLPRPFKSFPGYGIFIAAINKNVITLYGYYGMQQIRKMGVRFDPTHYQPIVYYKASKSWKLLDFVANNLGGIKTYSK